MKSYSEALEYEEYLDRFNYLKLGGGVADETFGEERLLNQKFYNSSLWKRVRRDVIARDRGMDMALDGYEISELIVIHHINPIQPQDILNRSPLLTDMENLISVSFSTHNAIHFGDEKLLKLMMSEREPGDTRLW